MLSPRYLSVIAAVLAVGSTMATDPPAAIVPHPPADQRNRHYPSHRDPLLPNPLVKLPIGAVQPRGWLRQQLELQAAGFHGHLGEISAFLRKDKNAWLSPDGQGERGWEEVPYWLKGFANCAYLLGNQDQIKEAKVWIEGAIASQRDDGFFGPRGKGAESTVASTKGKYDLWPNMVMLQCLRSYHEFTGDRRVLDLMTKYFRWQLTVPEEEFLPPYWQHQRAADNLESVLWLYNRTGDRWLLDLARKTHRHTADWTKGIADWHNVNMTQAFGGPALYYPLSKDPRHLAAAERNYRAIREQYGQVPGGLFGGDENCRPGYTDPRQAVETCGMVEFMYTCERLLTVAGDPRWADRCEDVAFNSLPAALNADFNALRYLTAPNLIQSDKSSKAPGYENGGAMLEMNPHRHRCCQHNFGHGWPYLAEHLWMATADNGLAAVVYSDSEVKAKVGDGVEVTLEEHTRYPFDERVEIEVAAPRPTRFPLYLRVPEWCDRPAVQVNGQELAVTGGGPGYVRLERTWTAGDQITLTLPMRVRLRNWAKNHDSVSVDRGPLTFALKIGEKVVRSGGTDRWPAFEIWPTTPWNYGLMLDKSDPAASFKVVAKPWPADNRPFTHGGTPLEMTCQARRIPEWKSDYLGLVGLLQESPAKTSEPVETVTLIPMGAARLRIASFPVVGDGPNAHQWKVPPEALPLKVSASHCWRGDSVRAVADGRMPKSSDDHSIPRFTWWDHRGTAEWVQWEFDEPRKVSAVRVYWFDDEPRGGGCRTPASWRLLFRKAGAWTPVETTAAFGTAKDRFNETTFAEIQTDALRIEAQLRPGMSGGILEWEIK
jgi:DUF1680 family protein